MRPWVLVVLALCGVAAVAAAQAPARTPADMIRARQAGYKQMMPAFKSLFEQVRSREPSVETVRANSAVVLRYASQVGRWFPRGTGPETGIPTRAKAEIWADPRDFRARAAALLAAARRVHGAARAGDLDAVRAAFPALRQACADCHDRYRGPEL